MLQKKYYNTKESIRRGNKEGDEEVKKKTSTKSKEVEKEKREKSKTKGAGEEKGDKGGEEQLPTENQPEVVEERDKEGEREKKKKKSGRDRSEKEKVPEKRRRRETEPRNEGDEDSGDEEGHKLFVESLQEDLKVAQSANEVCTDF